MMFNLRDAMATGSIGFSKQFFCLSQGLREMRQQVEDELRAFAVIVEPAKTPFGKRKLPVVNHAHVLPKRCIVSLQPRKPIRANLGAAMTT